MDSDTSWQGRVAKQGPCHIPYLQQTSVLFRRIQGRCGKQGSHPGLFSQTRWVVCPRQNPSPANHGWAFSDSELCDRPQGGSEIPRIICVVCTFLDVFEAGAYWYSITYHMRLALVLTRQQMKTNTWTKPQHTWVRYELV